MAALHPRDSNPFSLDCAEIHWQNGNTPTAKHYDDIYFSPSEGLQETQYVFLQHNHLAHRWQNLNREHPGQFSIAETGFGTGLNFLAAWQLWQQHAPRHWQLHFVSVEKHPLKPEDLKRSLSQWPQLSPLTDQLIAAYPMLTPGHHLIKFDQGKINLHLLLGDASECFEQLTASTHPALAADLSHQFDAWFLDGFAPAKNPQLWSDGLLKLIADLSHAGTTLATFTAAGKVRRALMQQGFEVEKVPGFKQKREMLRATFIGNPKPIEGQSPPLNRRKNTKAPWYVLPKTSFTKRHAAIIGAGLAGITTAHALAQRGWHITLIERHGALAQEASGNPQGMLYTKLSPKPGKLNDFALSSYLYALRFYHQHIKLQKNHHDFCGLLQLVTQAKELETFHSLRTMLDMHPKLVQFVDADKASSISGITLQYPAYYFPESGWISPFHLCQQLSAHPHINTLMHSEAISLSKENTTAPQWCIYDQNKQPICQAEVVIIANSVDATQFTQSTHLPLKTIRGQISEIPATGSLAALNTVICHDGYITPAINAKNSIGATFDIADNDTSERASDHQRNLNKLYQAIPSLQTHNKIDPSTISGRASLRCTTPDHLPLVGQLPDYPQFLNDYARLRKDANWPMAKPGCYHHGLYINIGHGSRGLSSTPLCSEVLAAMIDSEAPALPRHLLKALNPARFVIRDLIRNKI
ncbi:MAG: bifunctional tRNA (5-methylaminomethyl-2-thiouridine)(34)-methyltransferase MnmD/FAD-dependent 5-carboxymethylaminomethyl-2-thiouridine(34) oxidoreductase MnmC [Spongiibacteraceae bacterium]|nr:bifunctional tRNA (5-methylaminomethyl-2-thiouridine)(34)-methyltransferase MnmD/FAD-dependent 5-carboxymethylaminomethyl-2-thiouridine(34) oxidoreductase MnmC [Spongiibacteraceae bacterium]